ncbi:MAG TPA: phage tail tape measure protein, partial [Desulfovibrio sp.]|nr:phage tail tape measure protein [Desulfovibrio sp.]
MSSKLQKLTFTVDALVGKATGSLGKVQQSLDSIAQKSKGAFHSIGYGAAGVWGAAQGITTLVQPAMDFNNAMRDVKSLDVHDKAMSALARKSLIYSIKYGEGAAGFVSSSYDIQSAIGGLEGADLANFTNASNVLAKATKADAATITNYMGTMYGIFKQDAAAMGNSSWVEK